MTKIRIALVLTFFLGISFTQLSHADETVLTQFLSETETVKKLKKEKLLVQVIKEIVESKKLAIIAEVQAERDKDAAGKGKGEVSAKEEDRLQKEFKAKVESKLKAFLNEQDSKGNTALSLARKNKAFKIVRFLKDLNYNLSQTKFHHLDPDVLAHIAGHLTNREFLQLKGTNKRCYEDLSAPISIKIARSARKQNTNPATDPDLYSNDSEDWQNFNRYYYEIERKTKTSGFSRLKELLTSKKVKPVTAKFGTTPAQNLALTLKNKKDLVRFLNDKELQEQLKQDLTLMGHFKVDLDTLKKLAEFKYLKSLTFGLTGYEIKNRLAFFSALSQTMGSMPQLEAFSITSEAALISCSTLELILRNPQLQVKLKHLRLHVICENEDSWRDLGKFKKLESLSVGPVNINKDSGSVYRVVSQAIQQLRGLKALRIDTTRDKNNVGGDRDLGYSELAKGVNNNLNLISFTLENHANGSFFHHFGDHLSETNNIQKLEFKNSSVISGDHFKNFFSKMKNLKYIKFTGGVTFSKSAFLKGEFTFYKSAFLKMITALIPVPSIEYVYFPFILHESNSDKNYAYFRYKYRLFPIAGVIEEDSIPENEKFSINDEEVIAALKSLQAAHPKMKIVFNGSTFDVMNLEPVWR